MRHQIEGWQKRPEIAAVVKAAFPSYRRKKVALIVSKTVTLMDLNWSSGTKSEYVALTLDGQRIVGNTDRYSQMAPWDNPAEGKTLPIEPGFCVVRGGHFCGKQSLVDIYIHPDNATKLLTT